MSSERDQSATEDAPPVAVLLGMNSLPAPEGVGIATMTIQDKHRQRAGVVQGGLIVTLADYAFFEAVHTRMRPGDTAVTVELKVNFLAPARDGELTATARLIGAGRRIVVGEVDVTDDRDTLIARCLGTCLVRTPGWP